MTLRNAFVGRTLFQTAAADEDIRNGLGNQTTEYNDTDGEANGNTFLTTSLRSIDHAQVTVSTNNSGLSANNVGVQVTTARPAVPGDYSTDFNFIPGSVLIVLTDEDGTGELADDFNIESLEFEVVAQGQ